MNDFLEPFNIATLLIAVFGGILIGIPTGPGRFFVLDTSFRKGRSAALQVYGGLFSSIFIYAGLALLADDFISQNPKIELVSNFVASLLLIFWGVFIIFRSNKENKSSEKPKSGSWFLKGAILGFSNPVVPFVYLAFIQVLKIYAGDLSLLQKAVFVLLFECFSFLTTSVLAFTLIKNKKSFKGKWVIVKILAGILLIGYGAYSSYRQLDFTDGIKLIQKDSFLEEQVKKSGK